MSRCIDVFYTPDNRIYKYISFVMDENGAVLASRTHHTIATVAEWCKRQQLPARSSSTHVRSELAKFGVSVKTLLPASSRLRTESSEIITFALQREQANLLRQLLTTAREWGEGGRSTVRYVFVAYADWLDSLDQELGRALAESRSDDDERDGIQQYVDVFYNTDDPYTPYQAWVWNGRRVVERVSHSHMQQMVHFCKQLGLPVVSNNAQMRAELRSYDIEAHAPQQKQLGVPE